MWSYVIPILTFVLGVVAARAFDLWLKRPKLRQVGGGGGTHTNYVSIRNEPGRFPPPVGETYIFGKHVHGRWAPGIPFERIPASECRAHIYERETGQHVAPLYWRTESGFATQISIAPGETVQLMLFAESEERPEHYFIFVPKDRNDRGSRSRVPDITFRESREFLVRVHYAYDRYEFRFSAAMEKGLDGKFRHRTAHNDRGPLLGKP